MARTATDRETPTDRYVLRLRIASNGKKKAIWKNPNKRVPSRYLLYILTKFGGIDCIRRRRSVHQFKKNSKSLKGGHAGVELSEKKTAPLRISR